MANQKFTAIQNTAPAKTADTSAEVYRFNLKLPIECKDFLQEMAWRNRTTITEYLAQLVRADLDAHPECMQRIDHLNTRQRAYPMPTKYTDHTMRRKGMIY